MADANPHTQDEAPSSSTVAGEAPQSSNTAGEAPTSSNATEEAPTSSTAGGEAFPSSNVADVAPKSSNKSEEAPTRPTTAGDDVREQLARILANGGVDPDEEPIVTPDDGGEDDLDSSVGSENSDSTSEETEGTESVTTGGVMAPPPMPPKNLDTENFVVPNDTADNYIWFRILEPRETKGFDGPYNEEDLRHMYKKGELSDETMLWAEGRRDWEQLLYMTDLRPRLIQVPIIPPRVAKGTDNDHEAFNPLLTAPKKGDASGARPLDPFLNVHAMESRFCCSRCGSQAVGHMHGVGEVKTDMVGLRQSVTFQNAQMATEVVPGIVWCGNSTAAKLNPIIDHGMTLVINCTNNMGNPAQQLPHFRTKQVPLKDKPSSAAYKEDVPMIMDLFEKACDYIEVERINPERSVQMDPLPEPDPLTAKTDKYGRVIRSQAERAINLRLGKVKKTARVLLWSRKGLDRPCVIAMAYMIRQYGITYQKAMSIVEISRPGALVCKYYKKMLQEWAKRYTKGELLCIDCVNTAKEVTTHSTFNETLLPTEGMLNEPGAKAVNDDPNHKSNLATYLDMIPEEGAQSNRITKLGDVSVYLPKIYHGAAQQTGWTGLLDLELTGRNLGDTMVHDLFEAFCRAGVCMMLRTIALRSNGITCKGMKAILEGLSGTLGGGSLAATTAVSIKDLLAARMAGAAGGLGMMKTKSATTTNGTTDGTSSGSASGETKGDADADADADAEKENEKEEEEEKEMFPHLLSLDLADNQIGEDGAAHLAELVKRTKEMVRLDVSYNPLGDTGCKTLVSSIAALNPDFADEAGAAARDERYNNSITYVDLSCCEIGHQASEQMLDMFRSNKILHTLYLDSNPGLVAQDLKHVFNAIRSYSRCLQRLSLSDNNLSTKSMGYLCRIIENIEVPLRHLDIAGTHMTTTHTSYLANSIMKSHHLDTLNLNSNKLGEDGTDKLAEVLYVDPDIFVHKVVVEAEDTETADQKLRKTFVNHTMVETYADIAENMKTAEEKDTADSGEHLQVYFKGVVVPGPPLVTVDASYCSLHPTQAKALLKALCSRPTMRVVRLSGNNFGDDLGDIIADIKVTYIRELQLNQCQLMSKGTNVLLEALCDTSNKAGPGGNTLGSSLRALYLANNDIHDSSVDLIGAVVNKNMVLEHLDLGFNQLSSEAGPRLRDYATVNSKSSLQLKVTSMSVNLLGNRCDQYCMDLPGLSRAKSNFRLGTKVSGLDDLNDGYSHIPQVSRKHFFLRQQAEMERLGRSETEPYNYDMNNWRSNNVA